MKWSISTHYIMRRCQRQLMFSHIVASHNANEPDRREAYVLKQLTPITTWQGKLVHAALEGYLPNVLKYRRPINSQELTQLARELANRQLAFSADKNYRQPGQTKNAAGNSYCALVEHEQDRQISPSTVIDILTTIEECFTYLATERDFLRLIQTGSQHKIEHTLNCKLDDVTVTAQLDLAFTSNQRKCIIVDWKVGESDTSDYSRQLLVYAFVASQSGFWPSLSPENFELYEVNLLKKRIQQHPVTLERLLKTEDFIYRSLDEMRGLIGDVKYQDLDPQEFDIANTPNTCSYCSFISLCRRWSNEGFEVNKKSILEKPGRISKIKALV